MAVVPEQLSRYIQQEDERERARGMLFPEGMATTREGMTGEGVTAGDIVDVYQGIGTSLLPVDAAQAFGRGDVLGGVGETAEYLMEFTPLPAAYRTGEALLKGEYETAALESLGVIPMGGKVFGGAAIRGGDRLPINDTEVPTITEDVAEPENVVERGRIGIPADFEDFSPTDIKSRPTISGDEVQTFQRPPLMPERLFSDLSDQKGSVLIPTIADRTRVGRFTDIAGEGKLTFGVDADRNYVDTQGGIEYMRTGDEVLWAAGKGKGSSPANILEDINTETLEDGTKVVVGDAQGLLMPTTQTVSGSNFNPAMAEATLRLFNSKSFDEKDLEVLNREFNKKLKNAKIPEKFLEDNPQYKNFEFGIDDFTPENIEKTVARVAYSGHSKVNKAFMEAMDMAPIAKTQFPNIANVRRALHNPALDLDMTHSGGRSLGIIESKNPLVEGFGSHRAYPEVTRGYYIGGLEVPLPRNIISRDFYTSPFGKSQLIAMGDTRFKDVPMGGTGRTYGTSVPAQIIDNQLIDEAGQYTDEFTTLFGSTDFNNLEGFELEEELKRLSDFYSKYR